MNLVLAFALAAVSVSLAHCHPTDMHKLFPSLMHLLMVVGKTPRIGGGVDCAHHTQFRLGAHKALVAAQVEASIVQVWSINQQTDLNYCRLGLAPGCCRPAL